VLIAEIGLRIDAALRKRGYPSVDDLKAGRKR
jgi:hypothetical protein